MEKNEIKRVTPEDIGPLQAIGRQTFSETFSARNTAENMKKYLSEEFSAEKVTAEINDPFSEFYFAVLEGRVIGYLKLNSGTAQTELQDEQALEIERIYVLQAFHGRKAGQVLFDTAIRIAKEKDVDYVWLGVWEENGRAIRFYEKNGFVAFGKHVFRLGDDAQTDIMMKLPLKNRNKE